MSKATRIRQQNARERVAAQRAAARKAEIRNRIFITGGSILGDKTRMAELSRRQGRAGGGDIPPPVPGPRHPILLLSDKSIPG